MLNKLRDEIHKNAVEHGWWEEERSFGEIIALCHSELSEALEEYRNGRLTKEVEEDNINIESIAEDIFRDKEEAKDSFISYVSESSNIQEEVAVDKEYVEKKLKRVRLKIDRDIDLYLSQDTYQDDMRFEIVRNGDGTINMVIKNIRNYIEK